MLQSISITLVIGNTLRMQQLVIVCIVAGVMMGCGLFGPWGMGVNALGYCTRVVACSTCGWMFDVLMRLKQQEMWRGTEFYLMCRTTGSWLCNYVLELVPKRQESAPKFGESDDTLRLNLTVYFIGNQRWESTIALNSEVWKIICNF